MQRSPLLRGMLSVFRIAPHFALPSIDIVTASTAGDAAGGSCSFAGFGLPDGFAGDDASEAGGVAVPKASLEDEGVVAEPAPGIADAPPEGVDDAASPVLAPEEAPSDVDSPFVIVEGEGAEDGAAVSIADSPRPPAFSADVACMPPPEQPPSTAESPIATANAITIANTRFDNHFAPIFLTRSPSLQH